MEFHRGDTFPFKFSRRDGNRELITIQADEAYFTVKKSAYDKDYLFQKKLSDGSIVFNPEDSYYYVTINPEDTEELDFNECYPYDIEVKSGNNVKTVTGDIFLKHEITTKENKNDGNN